MAYCIYLRKSRTDDEAEARGDGETLLRHEDTLLALSKKMMLPISAIYKEIVSGETLSARPVAQRLLSEVEKGVWDGVLVMEVERLARGDTIDQGIIAQTFKYSNTKIITPNKTYDPSNEFDEEYFEFGLFMSRREYKTINRRLNRGRMASIAEGKYIGNKSPLGYERTKLPKEKGYTLTINEDAETIKLIFEYFTIGRQDANGNVCLLGCNKIANVLNDSGIKTGAGLEWSCAAVGTILRNPVYIGKIKWGGRAQVKRVVDGEVVISRPRKKLEDIPLTQGLHPPIISDEQFYKAQSILDTHRRQTTPSKYVSKNPLMGIMICADCGSKMSRRPYNKTGYPDTLLCSTKGCKNASSSLASVEKAILKSLANHLEVFKSDVKKGTLPLLLQENSAERTLKSQRAELAKIEKQTANLYDLLEQGLYTKEIFVERSNILAKKNAAIQAGISKLENDIRDLASKQRLKDDIIPRIEHVLAAYNESDVKQKQQLLQGVVDRVIYKKTFGGRWKVAADDFSVELYPKL